MTVIEFPGGHPPPEDEAFAEARRTACRALLDTADECMKMNDEALSTSNLVELSALVKKAHEDAILRAAAWTSVCEKWGILKGSAK